VHVEDVGRDVPAILHPTEVLDSGESRGSSLCVKVSFLDMV